MTRLAAWVAVLAVLWALWTYGASFKNPWSAGIASPVLSHLPPAYPGCGEKCRD